MVGVLKLTLYRTRDTPANIQRDVFSLMASIGFKQSEYNASLYHKEMRFTRGGVADGDAATGVRGSNTRCSAAHGGVATGVGGNKRDISGNVVHGDMTTGIGRSKSEDMSVLVHGDDFVAT